jgi:hypothetical protein
VKAVLDTI